MRRQEKMKSGSERSPPAEESSGNEDWKLAGNGEERGRSARRILYECLCLKSTMAAEEAFKNRSVGDQR